MPETKPTNVTVHKKEKKLQIQFNIKESEERIKKIWDQKNFLSILPAGRKQNAFTHLRRTQGPVG